LQNFICQKNVSIIEALGKIDANNHGFLIVCDNETVIGVITDGDIRRDLIRYKDLSKKVSSIISSEFSFITLESDFDEICRLFKIEKNRFLFYNYHETFDHFCKSIIASLYGRPIQHLINWRHVVIMYIF